MRPHNEETPRANEGYVSETSDKETNMTIIAEPTVNDIRKRLFAPGNPYSALDIALAVMREHGLTANWHPIEEVDGTDVGWWEVVVAPEGSEEITVAEENGLWGVYANVEGSDGTFTPVAARSAAAGLLKAARLAEEINKAVAA